jgi:beta-lactam-binding protein with PASTA domain
LIALQTISNYEQRKRMKPLTRLMLVIAMVGAMLSSIVGAAGAQTADSAYIAAVNGASADAVAVTAGSEAIATDLAYAADGVGTTVPAGTYDIAFTGGTVDSVATGVDASVGTASTVVSGFGLDADTAAAYPIDITPIDAGMAKITVWNATAAPVMVSLNGEAAVSVESGAGTGWTTYAAGTSVPVDIDGIVVDVATPEDSYTDVFAVNDGAAAVAVSVVASMTDLIIAIAPPAAGDVAVPDVVNQTEADATSAITGLGLVAGTTEAPDETVPVGSVVSQDPSAGTMVAAGSTVNIVVSTGPDAPATIPVPDVTGQSAADAQAALEAEGFVVTVTEQPSADIEAGLVISTNPVAGTEVAPGTSVEMIVSSGQEDVVVPDFSGMSMEDAAAAAEAAGLTITFVEDADNPDPDGVVIDQDPAAGTTVAGGSEVVAQLSPDLGTPWSIVTLDENRQMTVTGVGLLPGSTVELSIVDTDLTESVAVQDDGTWTAKFDLSDVENDTEFLLVQGTAADTSDYEATFKIPAAGQSTEVATEEAVADDGGFPVWGWILLGLGLIAIVLLIVRMVTGGSDDTPAESPEA